MMLEVYKGSPIGLGLLSEIQIYFYLKLKIEDRGCVVQNVTGGTLPSFIFSSIFSYKRVKNKVSSLVVMLLYNYEGVCEPKADQHTYEYSLYPQTNTYY